MNTYYRVLWVDDDFSSVEQDRDDLVEFLDAFGIRADIVSVIAPDDGSVHESINQHLRDPELDIILVDYNMDGLKGDQLVELIRNSDHVYLPVIFYSSSPIQELFKAVETLKLDGVYVTSRSQIRQKFEAVVSSLLVKEQTIKRTRGLLMEGVSEIDARFKGLVLRCWQKLSEAQREEFYKYVNDRIIQNRIEGAARLRTEYPSDIADFEKYLDERFMKSFDTYSRWRMVKKGLTFVGMDQVSLAILEKFANDGETSLNKLRNNYAHQTRSELDVSHNQERCISIRRKVREHTQIVEHFESELPRD